MNNLNNLLITLFTALFCYILFYWIYKSCFAYKIIEGVNETIKNDSKTESSREPKKVTSETIKKEDEPPSEEDNKEELNNLGSKMQSNSAERQNSTAKGVPAEKLAQARFD